MLATQMLFNFNVLSFAIVVCVLKSIAHALSVVLTEHAQNA